MNEWNCFLEDVEKKIAGEREDSAVKNFNVFLLKLFYFKPYETEEDFYPQFERRLGMARETLF